MIIALEGPSAVGKTTLSQLLASEYLIIPEVNVLFEAEKPTEQFWYYKKQLERFTMARNSSSAILDGDVFQPIWYNWIFGYPKEFPSEEETIAFYLKNIATGDIAFPDLYLIIEADEKSLRDRKEMDNSRQRRNFEKHLKMIAPQRTYFDFLKAQTSIAVHFVNNAKLESTLANIRSILNQTISQSMDQEKNFQLVVEWLRRNRP